MAGEGHRLAVLPLGNISPDPGDAYFADGMTEELILALSQGTDLRVVARTSAMRYKGSAKSMAEIGRELDVRSVLEGSVRKAGSRVRITVQLIDAATEEHRWSQVYERDLEDIFAIQSDIAQRVAQALEVEIARAETSAIEGRATRVLDAYTLYLKGRVHLNQRSEEGLTAAIDHFERALERDPAYARAHAGLAEAHALLAWLEMRPPHEAFPKALAAAERALELDDRLAEAHTSLGFVRFLYVWDWAGTERACQRALELNPGYPPAHQYYADYLKAMGRFEEAEREMRTALELDPLSLPIATGVGHVLYLARQYDRAIEQYRAALEVDPEFLQARLWFGRPYLQTGRYREALRELEAAVEISEGSTISLAVLGHAHAAAGNEAEARRILETLLARAEEQYLPSYWIALIHVGLGDLDQAFEWLDRAFEERSSWLVWSKVEPRFDVLRPDPRFADLLERMDLLGPAPGAVPRGEGKGDVAALLEGLSALRLSRYRVAGGYYRFEESTRTRLKDVRGKILASLGQSTRGNENFLLWGPPGTGKTFFVEQVREQAAPDAAFRQVNLARVDEDAFRSWLAEVGDSTDPLLCFVDEVDSKPGEPWPYEALLPALEGGGAARRVFVLAGSTGTALEDMTRAIAARPKGRDLLSRIPHEHLVALPGMTVGDRLVVVAAQCEGAGRELGRPLAEIEKLALYYILLHPELKSARQLREVARRGLRRVPPGEDRLRFDHLFDPGDSRNKEFWAGARSLAPNLIDAFVSLEA